MSWLKVTAEGVVLAIHAVPRASKTDLRGLHGDAIKIRLQAPPVDGKANEALIRFLSQIMNVPARQIMIIAGISGRQKRILVSGIGEREVHERLGV